MFLPAQSPEYSPIELYFGFLKKILRKISWIDEILPKNRLKRNENRIANLVLSASLSIEPRHFKIFFERCKKKVLRDYHELLKEIIL